jgi:group I intron endonuclease
MIRNRYSGKFYIGSSQNIHNRKLNHLSNLRKGKHHAYKMQKEFEEYGEGAFEFYALKVIDFEQENKPPAFMNKASNYDGVTTKKKRSTLERYEQQLIDRFNPEYNVYSDVSQWKKDNYGQRSYY